MWAVKGGGTIIRSTNYGVTWSQSGNATVQDWVSIACDNLGVNIVACVDGAAAGPEATGVWGSTDGGDTWVVFAPGSFPFPFNGQEWKSIACNGDASAIIVVGKNNNTSTRSYYTSIDSGVTWVEGNEFLDPAYVVGSVTSSYDESITTSNTRYAVAVRAAAAPADVRIWTSDDAGVTFTKQPGTPGSENWKDVTSTRDGKKLFAVINGGAGASAGIWTGTNIGNGGPGTGNWDNTNSPGVNNWRSIATDDAGLNLVAGGQNNVGIYVSSDGGVTWSTSAGSPPASFNGLSFASNSNGTVLVAGEGTTSLAGPLWTLSSPPPYTGGNCVSIGNNAGKLSQDPQSIAIGLNAGLVLQNGQAVAIGAEAGKTGQGLNSIAIGALAGVNFQHRNSIVINATGIALDSNNPTSCYIAPIRASTFAGRYTGVLVYQKDGWEAGIRCVQLAELIEWRRRHQSLRHRPPYQRRL